MGAPHPYQMMLGHNANPRQSKAPSQRLQPLRRFRRASVLRLRLELRVEGHDGPKGPSERVSESLDHEVPSGKATKTTGKS